MPIDWDAVPQGSRGELPDIVPGITMLEVTEVKATEGALAGQMLQITRAFHSRAPGRDGEGHVHAWAEGDGVGFVLTGDAEAPWLQYELDARCAALPRHDERGTRRQADPTGDLDLTPLGRSPVWGA